MLRKFIPIFIISFSIIFGKETFNLKDGSSIKGERISEDEKSVTIETDEDSGPEFSASDDDLDQEFNQETEEELLDIPTFLRRQAN